MNTQPTNAIGKSVKRQRELLNELLGGALTRLVRNILPHMLDKISLESYLLDSCKDLPYCKYLFVLDQQGKQITANLFKHGKDESQFGRDRSKRPYMRNVFEQDFTLSDAYISGNKKRPSLTAIQVIRDENNERIGFLGVDYDLRELPREDKMYEEPRQWRQIKGDPAIRGGLFLQQRVESQMDTKLEDVMTILEELMLEHGVYHCQIHYSSSRVTIWHIDDPYTYRILTMDELSDTEICLAYPKRPYFDRNIVPKDDICNVFKQFSALRFADETIYLRSGSLNLVNGFVGLNFSCDGTHYLIFDDFLNRGLDFWFGVSIEGTDSNTPSSTDSNKTDLDMKRLDNLLEDIAQLGCLEVNQIIQQLDSGAIPASLKDLKLKDQQYIHNELKSVMTVYEDGVSSIKNSASNPRSNG